MGSSFYRTAALAVATWIALPAVGSAQTIPSPLEYLERRQEAGIFGGLISTGTGRFGYGPSGGPMLGARYGLELSGPLGIEGTVGFIDSERDVIDPSQIEENRVIGQASDLLTTIDARIRFSFAGRRMWHRISPFLTLGGGLMFSTSDRSDLDNTLLPEDVFDVGTSFYTTIGLGSRWFVTDRVALRGDVVFSLWQIDTPPGYSDPERGFLQVEDGEWTWGNTLNLALLWRW